MVVKWFAWKGLWYLAPPKMKGLVAVDSRVVVCAVDGLEKVIPFKYAVFGYLC